MNEFVSYAQNGEDVVVARALQGVDRGVYVEVGANHPLVDSVTRAFYDRGWRGILAEPNPEYAMLLREERPGDWVEESIISARTGRSILHSIKGTGLSTMIDAIGEEHRRDGYEVEDLEVASVGLSELIDSSPFGDGPIHFLSIDTEGAELSVLQSLDLTRHRPWIMVIEATAPNSTRQVHQAWEGLVLEASYQFCLFDGLSRFYVSSEHADLAPLLSYPACVLDHWLRYGEHLEIEAANERARGAESQAAALRQELADLRSSTSWKVTAPVRAVGSLLPHRDPVAPS